MVDNWTVCILLECFLVHNNGSLVNSLVFAYTSFFIIHFQKLYIGSRFYLINSLELVEQMNLSFVRIFEYVLV